jgi:hypothetical protein
VVIGFYADRIDHADIQFARDNHRRRHSTTGNGNNGTPRATAFWALAIKTPSKRTRIAVKLIPAYVKSFFVGQAFGH